MPFSQEDHAWMQQALELAQYAASNNEVPVGAILVQHDNKIGEGSNAPIINHDPTAHAEIQAIRQAATTLKNYRLPDTTLYITLEPCTMCAGAIIHARIKRVVIATREPRAGAAGSVFDLLNHDQLNHRCEVDIGLMAEQSAALLKDFFKQRRS